MTDATAGVIFIVAAYLFLVVFFVGMLVKGMWDDC